MIDRNRIKLVILDVDGTLTDGTIIYDSIGNEAKHFDVKDGLAIKVAMKAGLKFAVITGRISPIVRKRVDELGIDYLEEGVQVKYPALISILHKLDLQMDEVCYIGDDWNDLQCIKNVGLSACPADADITVKKNCSYISTKSGGHGAVRDCLIFLLGEEKWDMFANKLYFGEGIE